jgi:hypothetical protein
MPLLRPSPAATFGCRESFPPIARKDLLPLQALLPTAGMLNWHCEMDEGAKQISATKARATSRT